MSPAAPAPYDVIIDSVEYMLARSDRQPQWKEQVPQGADPNGGGILSDIQTDFSGGVGLTQRTGTAEGQRMLSSSGGASAFLGMNGIYGFAQPTYKVTSSTVATNDPIRSMTVFTHNGLVYVAADDAVWVQNSFPTTWTSSTTFTMPVLELCEAQLTNSTPLLWAAIQHQPYATFDGSTWEVDASAAMRTGVCTGFLQTQNNGTTFTDATSSVSDSTASTVATLSSYDTLANGDYVLVGYSKPFSGLTMDLTLLNATASVLAVHYFDGATWVAVSGLTDGTAAAGATLGQDGTIAWTRPADEWVKTKIANESLLQAMFWVRLSWSVALDASTTVTQCDIRYREEATTWAVVGKRLHRGFDHGRTAWSEDGGRKATWNDGADAVGAYNGQIVGMLGAADLTGRGAAYLLRNDVLGASSADGSFEELLRFDTGGATNSDDVGYCSFVGDLYVAGPNGGFFRASPLSGSVTPMGPERLMLSEETSAQGRITAAVGDRDHLIWAALYNPVAATSFLWVWGTYRPELSEGGSIQAGRFDVWNMACTLGSVKVQSMAVVNVSSQPYLLMGTNTGVVLSQKLPAGLHPLDANSGCAWQLGTHRMDLPTVMGPDPTRLTLCKILALEGRNISASNKVSVYTKAKAATSWVSQGDITAAGQELALATAHAGIGLDVRLDCVNASESVPLIVESVVTDYRQNIEPARIARTITVMADEYVRRRDGQPIPRRAQDWETLLDALLAKCNSNSDAAPVSLVWSDGSTDTVWVVAKREAGQQSDAHGQRRRAVALDLVSAT